MTDRFDEAWESFAAEDRARQAPGDLERRILDAVAEGGPAPRRHAARYAAVAIAASVVAAITVWQPWLPPPAVSLLASRTFAATPLPPAILPRRPVVPARIDVDRSAALIDWIALYQDLPIILMLDAAQAAPAEPLQLVRLRVSMDTLQALGIATLGPDTGLVDVDLLIGEDGLPKTIRHVRLAQEEP